ncbi:hypothetical protein J2X98_004266 [Pseudarthrobacter enclensis]|uniref:Uncharacterized protein n=1 Tax=Pseudarthrobacter enclensis TaxID=993070 RepID=A0ABT9S031_9MICC|nr:hypothetical protein [Pseudarthrobacter enclensis]
MGLFRPRFRRLHRRRREATKPCCLGDARLAVSGSLASGCTPRESIASSHYADRSVGCGPPERQGGNNARPAQTCCQSACRFPVPPGTFLALLLAGCSQGGGPPAPVWDRVLSGGPCAPGQFWGRKLLDGARETGRADRKRVPRSVLMLSAALALLLGGCAQGGTPSSPTRVFLIRAGPISIKHINRVSLNRVSPKRVGQPGLRPDQAGHRCEDRSFPCSTGARW